jgi:hypothetical protein
MQITKAFPEVLTQHELDQVSGGQSAAVNDWDFHYDWKHQVVWQPWQLAIWVDHLYEEHSGVTDVGDLGTASGPPR